MSGKRSRERWVKILALALCVLLSIAGVFLLIFLAKHPVLLFAAGLISAAILVRATCYTPKKQRAMERTAKAAAKAKRRRWKSHPFYPVSKRARTAYLALCLEEALLFYGQDLQQWRWVLTEIWAVTTTDDMARWASQMIAMEPETILISPHYAAFQAARTPPGGACLLSESQFTQLQALYRGAVPGLETIMQLLDCIFYCMADGWDEEQEPYSPSPLQYIDIALQLLKEKNIPLPHNEPALQFLMSQRDRHDGKPFDGLRLSALSALSAD